jgi:hypothetical protein
LDAGAPIPPAGDSGRVCWRPVARLHLCETWSSSPKTQARRGLGIEFPCVEALLVGVPVGVLIFAADRAGEVVCLVDEGVGEGAVLVVVAEVSKRVAEAGEALGRNGGRDRRGQEFEFGAAVAADAPPRRLVMVGEQPGVRRAARAVDLIPAGRVGERGVPVGDLLVNDRDQLWP